MAVAAREEGEWRDPEDDFKLEPHWAFRLERHHRAADEIPTRFAAVMALKRALREMAAMGQALERYAELERQRQGAMERLGLQPATAERLEQGRKGWEATAAAFRALMDMPADPPAE